jgi:hypothetical protein
MKDEDYLWGFRFMGTNDVSFIPLGELEKYLLSIDRNKLKELIELKVIKVK